MFVRLSLTIKGYLLTYLLTYIAMSGRCMLQVLFLTHPRKSIRDTSRFKPFRQLFRGGTPSLKKLSQKLLSVHVQEGEHNSVSLTFCLSCCVGIDCKIEECYYNLFNLTYSNIYEVKLLIFLTQTVTSSDCNIISHNMINSYIMHQRFIGDDKELWF